VLTGNAIVTKLQSFKYKGDCKNFNFDKYVHLHVEQHNQHADLQEYRVAPLAKNLKTLWFQDGIKDPSLDAVKAPINANHANSTDFDSVKDAYVDFKRTEKPTNDPRTRQVALSLAVGMEAGVFHGSRTADKDRRPVTSARRGLFPRMKSTSRPTLLTGTTQMPSLTD
jgi:hypothetical protein